MSQAQKVTVPQFQSFKANGQKISVVTAYDYTFAKIFDAAGVEALLVGDSLGMVIQGRPNTLGVTLDQMIYHCHCVANGAQRAHVIGDLPFMSYQASLDEAVRSAGAMMKRGHVDAVKLEGGLEVAEIVARLTDLGIPVMGHVGLTPQKVKTMGGYKVQGRDKEAAKKILQDAQALAEAGAYSIVLEGIPLSLGKTITENISIPTIGIGSGPHCDGQVLVCQDLLGMDPDFSPKFVKKYADLHLNVSQAVRKYIQEVRSGAFPQKEHSYLDEV